MNEMKDYYAILGIQRNATPDEIKHRFRELARQYHPDKHVSNPLANLASEKFKQIQEAYSVLSDPEKRRNYDLNINDSQYNGNEYQSAIAQAQKFMQMRLWNEALENVDRAISLNPTGWDPHALKGVILFEQQNYLQASKLFKHAIELGADEGSVFNYHAASLINSNQPHEALPSLKKAIELDGEVPLYLTNMAICYENMGQPNNAQNVWERIQTIDPSNEHLVQRRQNLRQSGQQDCQDCQAFACICLILEHIFDCC